MEEYIEGLYFNVFSSSAITRYQMEGISFIVYEYIRPKCGYAVEVVLG